jgi:hypothetical protein
VIVPRQIANVRIGEWMRSSGSGGLADELVAVVAWLERDLRQYGYVSFY